MTHYEIHWHFAKTLLGESPFLREKIKIVQRPKLKPTSQSPVTEPNPCFFSHFYKTSKHATLLRVAGIKHTENIEHEFIND